MAIIKVMLKNGRNSLPLANPGDTWECHFNTGPNGDMPCQVDAYAGGPNLGFTATLADASGTVFAGSAIGPSTTVTEVWNAKNAAYNTVKSHIPANTDLVFSVTLDKDLNVGSYGGQSDLVLGRG